MSIQVTGKGEQTRQRILDITQAAILRKGFAATSLDEIIAGVDRHRTNEDTSISTRMTDTRGHDMTNYTRILFATVAAIAGSTAAYAQAGLNDLQIAHSAYTADVIDIN
jgi:hypothetical protein